MSPSTRSAKPKPVPPWRRAEAGQYRSSDERFTIGSEGPSRWFVTDDQELDELGLARTVGPFATLDAAKEAAEAQRAQGPQTSPLAERIATSHIATSHKDRARSGPAAMKGTKDAKATKAPKGAARRTTDHSGSAGEPEPAPEPPPPPPPTWLDTLAEQDRDAARRARRLLTGLEEAGLPDADDLVRRDVIGDQPVVAARLLANAIIDAVTEATGPTALDRLVRERPAKERDAARTAVAATAAVEAVFEVLGAARSRRDLPGWRLVERSGPDGEPREIRLTRADLRRAAEDRGAR